MKTIILFTGLFLMTLNLRAQRTKPEEMKNTSTVEVSSLLTAKGKTVNHYTISVLCDGKEVHYYDVKKSQAVYISLEPNKVYSVVYEKEGFEKKIVIVNTQIPHTALSKKLFFEYTIELDPVYSARKPEYNDYPVALLHYSKKEKEFSYSEDYFNQVHNGIETARK